MSPWDVLTGKKAEDFMKQMVKEGKEDDEKHPEKYAKFGYKWNKNTKYQWTDKMDEVSGFGGFYEETCRFMITKMLEWLDKQHDVDDPEYSGYKNVYGLTKEENVTARMLRDYILKEVERYFGKIFGPSGAQYQATTSTVLWIRSHSWEEFVKIKEKQKTKVKFKFTVKDVKKK